MIYDKQLSKKLNHHISIRYFFSGVMLFIAGFLFVTADYFCASLESGINFSLKKAFTSDIIVSRSGLDITSILMVNAFPEPIEQLDQPERLASRIRLLPGIAAATPITLSNITIVSPARDAIPFKAIGISPESFFTVFNYIDTSDSKLLPEIRKGIITSRIDGEKLQALDRNNRIVGSHFIAADNNGSIGSMRDVKLLALFNSDDITILDNTLIIDAELLRTISGSQKILFEQNNDSNNRISADTSVLKPCTDIEKIYTTEIFDNASTISDKTPDDDFFFHIYKYVPVKKSIERDNIQYQYIIVKASEGTNIVDLCGKLNINLLEESGKTTAQTHAQIAFRINLFFIFSVCVSVCIVLLFLLLSISSFRRNVLITINAHRELFISRPYGKKARDSYLSSVFRACIANGLIAGPAGIGIGIIVTFSIIEFSRLYPRIFPQIFYLVRSGFHPLRFDAAPCVIPLFLICVIVFIEFIYALTSVIRLSAWKRRAD